VWNVQNVIQFGTEGICGSKNDDMHNTYIIKCYSLECLYFELEEVIRRGFYQASWTPTFNERTQITTKRCDCDESEDFHTLFIYSYLGFNVLCVFIFYRMFYVFMGSKVNILINTLLWFVRLYVVIFGV